MKRLLPLIAMLILTACGEVRPEVAAALTPPGSDAGRNAAGTAEETLVAPLTTKTPLAETATADPPLAGNASAGSAVTATASGTSTPVTAGTRGSQGAFATATVVATGTLPGATLVIPTATATPLPGVPTNTPDPGAEATAAALATLVQAATATQVAALTAVPVTATPTPVVQQPVVENFVLHGLPAGPGATVGVDWTVHDARDVSFCYYFYGLRDQQVGADCWHELPLTASGQSFVLGAAQAEVYYVEFALAGANGVPQGDGVLGAPFKEDRVRRVVPALCPSPWFHGRDEAWCPGEAARSYAGAIAQRFERGLAIYLPALIHPPNRVIVLYDDGRATQALGVTVEAPPADLQSPAGFPAPAPEFYRVWALGSNSYLPALRDSLGWPAGAPQPFTAQEQCAEGPWDQTQPCYLAGPDGTLYRVDWMDFVWERAN